MALVEQIEAQEQKKYSNKAFTRFFEASRYEYGASTARQNLELRDAVLEFASAKDSRRKEIVDKFFRGVCNWTHSRQPQKGAVAATESPFVPGENLVLWPSSTQELLTRELARPSHQSLCFTESAWPWLLENHAKIPDRRVCEVLQQLQVNFADHPAVAALTDRSLKYTDPDIKNAAPRSFGSSLDRMLTAAQLAALGKSCSRVRTNATFIEQEYKTRFGPLAPAGLPRAERRELLDRLFAFATDVAGRSDACAQYASPIMHMCMDTLLECDGEFNFDWFDVWTKLDHLSWPFVDRSPGKTRSGVYQSPFASFPHPSYSIVAKYLLEYYRRQPYEKYSLTDLGKFGKIFSEDTVTTALISARTLFPPLVPGSLASASPLPGYVTSHYLFPGMRATVQLEWAPHNATLGSTPDAVAGPVTLHAVLKNVPSVTLKVFRVNTTAYYKKFLSEVSPTLELDGLTAHEEQTFDFSSAAPSTRIEKTFTIESLRGRRGVFVVELEGNGQSVRAVVRKGLLTFLEHSTASGHAFRIFDEARQPVPDATISLGTRVFTPDAKSGFIFVPYSTENKEQPIVITSEQASGAPAGSDVIEPFSSLGSFSHRAETYELTGAFVVAREALRSRAVAEVVIRAVLSRNGVPVADPSSLLKRVKLTVVAVDTDNVSATQTIDNFVIPAPGADAVHKFSVPAGLSTLNFTLEGVVTTTKGDESVLVLNSTGYAVNAIEQSPLSMRQMLLRREPGAGYVAVLTGKGGEPLGLQYVTVTLQHRLLSDQSLSRRVRTDPDGRVVLGALTDTASAIVTCAVSGVSCTYDAAHVAPRANVPSLVREEEGVTIRIPYLGAETAVRPAAFSLLRLCQSDSYAESNIAQWLSLDLRSQQLVLTGLPQGTYELAYLQACGLVHRTTIKVLRRDALIMGSYVHGKSSFDQLQRGEAIDLSIGAVTGDAVALPEQAALAPVGATAAADSEIVIQIGDASESTRVHVYSSHFEPDVEDFYDYTDFCVADARSLPIPAVTHDYLGQRLLSGEQQYVIDRKRGAKQVGNMLTRPTLLLAKRFKRATEMDKDPSMRKAGEQHVKAKREVAEKELASFDRRSSNGYGGRGGRGAVSRSRMGRADGGGAGRRFIPGQRANHNAGPGGRSYVTLEFLRDGCTRLLNLKPDAQGRVTVRRDQLGPFHASLTVVAVDGGVRAAVRTVGILPTAGAASAAGAAASPVAAAAAPGEAKVSDGCVDVRLPAALTLTKHYTQQHLITPLCAAGDALPIADVRSSRVEVFSSLTEVVELLTSMDDNANARLLSKFSFLSRWPTLSRAEKEEKFNDFLSHELNFFIFCKDKAFFADVVAPHLRNRSRKSVVDLYLLGAEFHPQLAQYLAPSAFKTLNAFERVLVAHAAGVTAVADMALFVQDQVPRRDLQRYTALFLAAIQSRALALGQSTTEQLREQAKNQKKPKRGDKDKDDAAEGGPDGDDDDGDDDHESDYGASSESDNDNDFMADECEEELEAAPQRNLRKSVSKAMMGGAPPPPPPPCAAPMMMRSAAAPRMMMAMAAPCSAPCPAPGASMSLMSAEPMLMESLASAPGGGGYSAPMKKKAAVRDEFGAAADAAAGAAANKPRALFTAPEMTGEYEEREYYDVASSSRAGEATRVLVPETAFWADYARYLAENPDQSAAGSPTAGAAGARKPFLSSNILEVSRVSFSHLIFALAVTDLPFTAPAGNASSYFRVTRNRAELVAPGPLIAFHEEVRETPVAADGACVSVTQVYFDPNDTHVTTATGERIDKYIEREFLPLKAYGCRVVVTNVASAAQQTSLLLQVPVGSVPLRAPYGARNGDVCSLRTKTIFVSVAPYSTHVVEYFFYFPGTGSFGHYPVQVSKTFGADVRVIGSGAPAQLSVVPVLTTPPDTKSWEFVSQEGTDDEVLAFLAAPAHNIHKYVSPVRVAFRCRNAGFFVRLTALLRSRSYYDQSIWSYALFALYSNDTTPLSAADAAGVNKAAAEFLSHEQTLAAAGASSRVGPYLSSPFLVRDAHAGVYNEYQHLEYLPIINARAHSVNAADNTGSGGSNGALSRARIQNKQLREQYTRFLQYLAYSSSGVASIATGHLISAIYYLLLQDRVEDARDLFAVLDARRARQPSAAGPGASPTVAGAGAAVVELQLDYLTAYFDFFSLALQGPAAGADAIARGATRARAIAAKHSKYPVRFWRKLFSDVEAHIAEALDTTIVEPVGEGFAMVDEDGSERAAASPAAEAGAAALNKDAFKANNEVAEDRQANRARELDALAVTEPHLEFTVEKGAGEGAAPVLKIVHANLAACVVHFHRMDLESLFSSNPFIAGESDKFTLIAPNASLTVDLTISQPTAKYAFNAVTYVPVPPRFAAANVHVQVTAPSLGITRASTHFSHALLVQVIEGFGQVKVAAAKPAAAGASAGAGRAYGPLPGAYVKCFAKLKSGVVDFYKDGYTDLRGRFDYASLSTDKLKSVDKFAILVYSDEFGACVKEAGPPSN
jgi:hypothetical protein